MNHRTARKGGGHFFNSSLTLPPASQNLGISWAMLVESSPLHIGSSQGVGRGLTMMLNYKGGEGWGGVKNLGKGDNVIC